jgi:DNA-binding SARP family transcriptional activator
MEISRSWRQDADCDAPEQSPVLELLDGFSLRVASGPVEVSDMAQRLVALVALRARPVCRSLVAGTLWPDKSESRASANLRSSLCRLNAAGPVPIVLCSGSSLLLDPRVRLDVALVEERGWALLDGSGSDVTHLNADWFSKELLPGWYDDWVIIERERLGQLQIRFLESWVHRLREAGHFARAIDNAIRLVAIDPLRERSQLALIHALADEGSWGRAHWQADQYCRLLEGAFGRDASLAFIAAYQDLIPFDRVLAR